MARLSLRSLLLAGLASFSMCASSALAEGANAELPRPGARNVQVEQLTNSLLGAQKFDANETQAFVVQNGAGNTATVTQYTGYGVQHAIIVQDGPKNTAKVSQWGNAGAVVEQDSTGYATGNFAKLTQLGFGADGVTAHLSQKGSGNEIRLLQAGSNLSADFKQDGQSNTIELAQIGKNSSLSISQTGNNLPTPKIFQSGIYASSGTVVVTQTGPR